MLGLVLACTKLCGACPRMSVGYAEVLPFRGYYPTKMGQASAYRRGNGENPSLFHSRVEGCLGISVATYRTKTS